MYDLASGAVPGEIVVARRVRIILQARTNSRRLPAKVSCRLLVFPWPFSARGD